LPLVVARECTNHGGKRNLGYMDALRQAERRRAARVTPNPLTVIRLPSGIRGVLLDISASGLGFLASAPIDASRSIQFTLAVKSIEDLEVGGELVWKDGTGKRGGVRFTHLPAEVREQVRVWLQHPHTDTSVPFSPQRTFDRSFDAESEFTPSASRTKSSSHASVHKSFGGRKAAINAITILLAFCVAAGIWSSIYRRETSDMLSRTQKNISAKLVRFSAAWRGLRQVTIPGTESDRPTPVTSAPDAANAPTTSDEKALLPPEQEIPPASSQPAVPAPPEKQLVTLKPEVPLPAPKANAKENPSATATKAPPAASKGEAELALARGFLHDDATPEEITEGVQQLWVAVEKGSIEAEVELADLYVHGQGVPKNCDQARVLLTAASNAKNAAAIDKLKNLDDACQ